MSTGPRYARRTDNNHDELRQVIKDCKKAFPKMQIVWEDTSNMGGRVGDGIIQFVASDKNYDQWDETHLLEFKSSRKAKLTTSQERGLELVRIDNRADIFELLGQNDWELA